MSDENDAAEAYRVAWEAGFAAATLRAVPSGDAARAASGACAVCGGSGESEGGLTRCPGCDGSGVWPRPEEAYRDLCDQVAKLRIPDGYRISQLVDRYVAAALRAASAAEPGAADTATPGEPTVAQVLEMQFQLNGESEPDESQPDGWDFDVCERILRKVLAGAPGRAAPNKSTERIACGQSHPDSRINADLQDMRDDIGAPPDTAGCGGEGVWTFMYRCVECCRWFHRDCIRKHFAAHRDAAGGEPADWTHEDDYALNSLASFAGQAPNARPFVALGAQQLRDVHTAVEKLWRWRAGDAPLRGERHV